MFYFVKGISHEEDGNYPYEWVVKAESKEGVLEQLEINDEVLELREISVEERIDREKNEIFQNIKMEYLICKYGDLPVREYSKIEGQLNKDLEMYYDALVYHNKTMRYAKRLLRCADLKSMTVDKFLHSLNALCEAQTEEEFDKILGETRQSENC